MHLQECSKCSDRTFGVYTSDSVIVLGLYIMHGTGRIVLLSWVLCIVRGTGLKQWFGGSLATARYRRWRLPPDRWWPLAVTRGNHGDSRRE